RAIGQAGGVGALEAALEAGGRIADVDARAVHVADAGIVDHAVAIVVQAVAADLDGLGTADAAPVGEAAAVRLVVHLVVAVVVDAVAVRALGGGEHGARALAPGRAVVVAQLLAFLAGSDAVGGGIDVVAGPVLGGVAALAIAGRALAALVDLVVAVVVRV